MSLKRGFLFAAGMCLVVSSSSYADEMCAVKVQNNDQYKRAVDHLRISPSDQPRADEIVTVNRIVMPKSIVAIHWNCPAHNRSYTIIGLSTEGAEIVTGATTPATSEMDVEQQPIAGLATKTQ
jgi:hypothetical protein